MSAYFSEIDSRRNNPNPTKYMDKSMLHELTDKPAVYYFSLCSFICILLYCIFRLLPPAGLREIICGCFGLWDISEFSIFTGI